MSLTYPDNCGGSGSLSEYWNILLHNQLSENFCELSMCKRKSPKSQVGSSIRNSSENELDGFDHLMNENFTEAVITFFGSHSFELSVKILHLTLSLVHHLVSDFSAVVLSVDSLILGSHHWFLHTITSVDVCEFDFIFLFIIVIRASSDTWLNEKHAWAENTDNDQKTLCNTKLSSIILSDNCLETSIIAICICGVSWLTFVITKAEDSNNHDIDN